MRYVSDVQPLCRYCGKPIGKHTITVFVKDAPSKYDIADDWCRYVYGKLYSKADCQRHTNQQVVSVSYDREYYYENGRQRRVAVGKEVHKFTTWDGRTYKDQFFCGGTCVQRFAYVMAEHQRRREELRKEEKP